MKNPKHEIVRETIRRFPQLQNRTIAAYLIREYGDLFNNDIEYARTKVRYCRGAQGKIHLAEAKASGVLMPPAQPMPETWNAPRHRYDLAPGLWLVLSDVHVPFHDKDAVFGAVKYGQAEKITGILLNGDFQDCAAVGFWATTKKREFDREVEVVIDMLDFLKAEFPKAKIVYKPGNHEDRLPRFYCSKSPELSGLPMYVAIDEVLGLERRGIVALDSKQIVMAGKLPILHGDEYGGLSTAVNPARGLFLKTHTWSACAHYHKTSEHSERDVNGTVLTTWSFACLCDLSPDYRPYSSWNHGVALVNVEKNGAFEVVNRRILSKGQVV